MSIQIKHRFFKISFLVMSFYIQKKVFGCGVWNLEKKFFFCLYRENRETISNGIYSNILVLITSWLFLLRHNISWTADLGFFGDYHQLAAKPMNWHLFAWKWVAGAKTVMFVQKDSIFSGCYELRLVRQCPAFRLCSAITRKRLL